LRARVVIAVIMIFTGVVVVIASVQFMLGGGAVFSWIIPLVVGVLLCVAGFVLMLMELLETWLGRGQKALVDGLQAG